MMVPYSAPNSHLVYQTASVRAFRLAEGNILGCVLITGDTDGINDGPADDVSTNDGTVVGIIVTDGDVDGINYGPADTV